MNQIQYQSGAIDPGGCISSAWELVKGKFGLYLGAGLVVMLLIGCVPVVAWFMFGPVMGGFYYIGLRDMRGEPVDFGMLFKGFDKFVPLMLAGLIQQVPGIILTIIQYTVDIARLVGIQGPPDVNFYQPSSDILASITGAVVAIVIGLALFSIIWTLALSFAIPLLVENNIGLGEALLTSVKAASSNPGGLIVLVILEVLVAVLGVIALCVGIFVAIPVIYLANVMAYRQVFPYLGPVNVYTGPPPPEYYGGSFGRSD